MITLANPYLYVLNNVFLLTNKLFCKIRRKYDNYDDWFFKYVCVHLKEIKYNTSDNTTKNASWIIIK